MRAALILVAAIALALCVSPVVLDDAEADGAAQWRMSDAYVLWCQLEIPEDGDYNMPLSGMDTYIFYQGSELDELMWRYIDDPQDRSISIPSGDLGAWTSAYLTAGTVLDVFVISSDTDEEIFFRGVLYALQPVLEPYGDKTYSFNVWAGDRIEGYVYALDNRGEMLSYWMNHPEGSVYGNSPDITMSYSRSGEVEIRVTSDWSLYCDVTLYHTGGEPYEGPTDSPVPMLVACLALAAAVFGLAMYAGHRYL